MLTITPICAGGSVHDAHNTSSPLPHVFLTCYSPGAFIYIYVIHTHAVLTRYRGLYSILNITVILTCFLINNIGSVVCTYSLTLRESSVTKEGIFHGFWPLLNGYV